MKRIATLFAATAIFLFTTGHKHKTPFTIVRFDNAPNGGTISNTATHDPVHVYVYFADGSLEMRTFLDFSMVSVRAARDCGRADRGIVDSQIG